MAVLTGMHALPAAAGCKSMPIEFLHRRPLSPGELEMLREQIESFDDITVVDDEIRGIVKPNWPHLRAMLPPEQD